MMNKKKLAGGFIAVQETAVRMQKENFSKIFEPSFTKRSQYPGTGHENPACHIIKAKRGNTDAEKPRGGRMMNFSIVLPVVTLRGK